MESSGSKELRKDFKFESFLKRVFDAETYSKVRYYDICVVIHNGKKAFKRIIVTDERIYTTDDTPKTIENILHFKEMVSIEMLNDYPDFLEGEFKNSAQHLVIKYLRQANKVKPTNSTHDSVSLSRTQPDISETNQSSLINVKTSSDVKDFAINKVETTKLSCCSGLRSRYSTLKRDTSKQPESEPELQHSSESELNNPCENETTELPETQESPFDTSELKLNLSGIIDTSPTLENLTNMTEQLVTTARLEHIRQMNLVADKLHIYILNSSTPALLLIKTAWNNYLVNGTLALTKERLVQNTVQSQTVGFVDENKIKYLYRQLKSDILNAENEDDLLFQFTQELYNSANRHFLIKKLFWENTDLWLFFCNLIARFMPLTSLNLILRESIADRVNELDFALIIIDLINTMLEGTETLDTRAKVLRINNGKAIFHLIKGLLEEPDVPQMQRLTFEKSKDMQFHEMEIERLLIAIINSATTLVYNIFQDGRDSPIKDRGDLNEAHIICFLEENLDLTKSFFHRMLAETFDLISPVNNAIADKLSPDQVVLLYRQFTILKSSISYSSILKSVLVDNYAEEFKYFVQTPIIIKRLSLEYPITYPTLRLIANITFIVTQYSAYNRA